VLFKKYYGRSDKKNLAHLNDIFKIEIDLKISHGLLFQGHISHFFNESSHILGGISCFFSSVVMLFTFDKEPLRLVFTIS
jgi:hypothetical protein